MNKILFIGNIGSKSSSLNGQIIKVRLYYQKIIDEGLEVELINLEQIYSKPFFVLRQIKKGIKKCDRIVLISASRGCKILIPYINKHNKFKKPVVLPLIGTSVLHYSIDKLNDSQKKNFLEGSYDICKFNKRMAKELSNLTAILPETDCLVDVFKGFYHLNNVFKLTNFRDLHPNKKPYTPSDNVRLVFLSRVMREKGIFDLISVLKDLNKGPNQVFLDIFGGKSFTHADEILFNSQVDNVFINYRGQLDNSLVSEVISKYDFLVFPTRFVGEGTPGVIVESLIGGTPVISSLFPQATGLLIDGYDSLLFEMFNENELKGKIIFVQKNTAIVRTMKKNAFESSKKYTYESQRPIFLKYICGIE